MKVKPVSRGLVMAISLAVALLVASAFSAIREAIAVNTIDRSELAGEPATSLSLAALGNDAVSAWNQQAVSLTLSASPALAPVQQTRLMAIVQTAVHDAVNGITKEYATYLPTPPPPENASPEAAAIAAAHYTLKAIFGNLDVLNNLYLSSLADHGLATDDPGIDFGRAAATAVLAARVNDHSTQATFPYDASGAGQPGVWVRLNNAPALLPGWGNVTPFVLRSGSQFRPDPPPALDSEQYARDYNEIKLIGVNNSPIRTTEQTQIALFWRASPTAIWNPVLQQVVAARELDLSAIARAFALFYLAAADASIACWEAKYHYNFWRPQPAIWGGDTDGNDETQGVGGWTPLVQPTPPHPEYPSGHSTNSSAMATILELLFGDEPGGKIEVTISNITRQWSRFSEGVDEVIEARIYSGMHFRTADEVGARQGRQVARFVMTHALKPCRKGGSRCS